MPLSKKDAPANAGGERSTASESREATNAAIDAGAGAPDAMREAAEALPEGDEVEEATKDAMLADDAQAEARAKAKVVDASPDAPETPSGHALKRTAGIRDDVRRGEEYTRIKSAMRHGYVPASEEDLK